MKDGLDLRENRFFIEGEGNIKYNYNNGRIASDPKLASLNFINALERIPKLIEKYHTDTERISKDLPVLHEIVKSTWRKEDELKALKSEFLELDRKIQLSLKPIDQSVNKTEQNEPQNNSQQKAISRTLTKHSI